MRWRAEMFGYTIVEADTEDEAREIAMGLPVHTFDWDPPDVEAEEEE